MLSVMDNGTEDTRMDYIEDQIEFAAMISRDGYAETGRWFDFDYKAPGVDIEVYEDGKPVGRIPTLDEARQFIGWITTP